MADDSRSEVSDAVRFFDEDGCQVLDHRSNCDLCCKKDICSQFLLKPSTIEILERSNLLKTSPAFLCQECSFIVVKCERIVVELQEQLNDLRIRKTTFAIEKLIEETVDFDDDPVSLVEEETELTEESFPVEVKEEKLPEEFAKETVSVKSQLPLVLVKPLKVEDVKNLTSSCTISTRSSTRLQAAADEDGEYPGKKFCCPHCDFRCWRPNRLRSHIMLRHEGQKPFPCDMCELEFGNRESRIIHKFRDHLKKFQFDCHHCDKGFYTKKNFMKHLAEENLTFEDYVATKGKEEEPKEKPKAPAKLKCPQCDFTAERPNRINAHILVRHEGKRPFKCDTCDATFISALTRTVHKYKVHLKAYPYQCHHCEKGFYTKITLKKHLDRVNGTLREVICQFCGEKFLGDKIYNHVNRVHKNVKKVYTCEECPGTVYRDWLAFHNHNASVHNKGEVRAKAPVRPRVCEHCNRSYVTKSLYFAHLWKKHKIRDEELKVMQCPYCDKAYYRTTQYRLHLASHTDTERHQCDKCDFAVYHKKKLISHMIRVHNQGGRKRRAK